MKKISLIVPETTKFVSMTFEVKSPNEKVHSHDTDCVVSTYMIRLNDDGKLPSEVQIDMDWIDSICVKENIYVDGQAAVEWDISSYCENDVIATETVWDAMQADFRGRQR